MIWLVLLVAVVLAWRIPFVRGVASIALLWLLFNWGTYELLDIDTEWNHCHPGGHFEEGRFADGHSLGSFALMDSLSKCRRGAATLTRFPAYDHPPFEAYVAIIDTEFGRQSPYVLEFKNQGLMGWRLWRVSRWTKDWQEKGRWRRMDVAEHEKYRQFVSEVVVPRWDETITRTEVP
jgi:hypothetical protein